MQRSLLICLALDDGRSERFDCVMHLIGQCFEMDDNGLVLGKWPGIAKVRALIGKQCNVSKAMKANFKAIYRSTALHWRVFGLEIFPQTI